MHGGGHQNYLKNIYYHEVMFKMPVKIEQHLDTHFHGTTVAEFNKYLEDRFDTVKFVCNSKAGRKIFRCQ